MFGLRELEQFFRVTPKNFWGPCSNAGVHNLQPFNCMWPSIYMYAAMHM